MYNPGASYRVQFHRDFTFHSFEQIIPYLQDLGIKTIYASPIFSAVPGSMHGYDITNPNCINPELGTEEQLRKISKRLQDAGMGWLQDIVPNHMALHPNNPWMMDVLKNGGDSSYSKYFDIDWEKEEALMVPLLGCSIEKAIESGDLKITSSTDGFSLKYLDCPYPANEESIKIINRKVKERGTAILNQDKAFIKQIADLQYYRLCDYHETQERINYRRFFTINNLISLRMERQEVFQDYHQYTKELLDEGIFQGLRVDHIDGLYDPSAYLSDLRSLMGEDVYIVVEKILEEQETLPPSWPIQGTTGYDFLADLNNLFTHKKSSKSFTTFYKQHTGDTGSIAKQLQQKKANILYHRMAGELDNLTTLFLKYKSATGKELEKQTVQDAIAQYLIQCPVYRYYDQQEMETSVQKYPLLSSMGGNTDFIRRLQQYTGPLMAKGLEDTLMYTYARFIGHNEVGDSPTRFGMSKEAFHKRMIARQQQRPLDMNSTATHDTKRGEDARAILNVLTQIPEQWIKTVLSWTAVNKDLKPQNAPDAQDEYFLYQTIVSTYPIDASERDGYLNRLLPFLTKALREGKRNSSWSTPNEPYEAEVHRFANAILQKDSGYYNSLLVFRKSIDHFAVINALCQLTLKHTCPGIPDTYQGTELWDQSLVDPDNRRPVHYALRREYALENDLLPEALEQFENGKVKLLLTQKLMHLRQHNEELFTKGMYLPLRTSGKYKDHVFAFARRWKKDWLVVAVPLYNPAFSKLNKEIDWNDTSILLTQGAAIAWHSLLDTGRGSNNGKILVQTIWQDFPVAVLKLTPLENNRSAGILLPINALPSALGMGDFGPEAKQFIKQLSAAGQSWWQVLPLNPVSDGAGYSPYSTSSGMACNPHFISAKLLQEQGLISEKDYKDLLQKETDQIDYTAVEDGRKRMLKLAYDTYKNGTYPLLEERIQTHNLKEFYWLQDYALYQLIKKIEGQKPWYQWPDPLKYRDQAALDELSATHADALEEIKWEQAIANMQWSDLRKFANQHGIGIIGDLPFYASHDSADVWAHPELFQLDAAGEMTGVAGVPPDYFSATGQLWGMPTYHWEEHRQQHYSWWISRLRKNMEYYDLLRIDHFRALANYWEVPAGEETAIKGKWLPGPGLEFFGAVKDALGGLPFVAEDLGEQMEQVYKLRDEVGLPGMRVLQFAFGIDLPTSVDAPHNFNKNTIAYTGTHDNNTLLGWWRNDLSTEDRHRISEYTGQKVTARNVTEVMIRMLYACVANTVIMPIQALLQLDESARTNTPSSSDGNWRWRMKQGGFSEKHRDHLLKITRRFGRG